MNFSEWLTSDSSARLALTLLHCLWHGTVVAVLALFVTRLWRGANAQIRYVVHVAALATMVACLPITYLLVTPPHATELDVVAVPAEPPERIATPGRLAAHSQLPAGAAPPEAITATDTFSQDVPTVIEMPAADTAAAIAPSDTLPPEPIENGTITPELNDWRPIRELAPYAVVIYLLGVVGMLLRVMVALWGGQRLRACAERITDSELLKLVQQQSRQLSLRAVPAIYYCRRVATPVVIGVLRPTILLPCAIATGLTGDQLQAVLMHELAHIRRLDPLVNLFQRVAEALLFFHPAAWYLSRQASFERENCCDDLVIGTGLTRLDYAQLLLRVAEISAGPPHAAALAATGRCPSQLRQRVLRLLSGDEERVRLTRKGTFSLAVVLMAAVLAPMFLFHAEAEQDEPTSTTEAEDDVPAPHPQFEIIEQDPATLRNLKTSWTVRDRKDGTVVQEISVHVGDRWEWQDDNGDGFADLRVWDGQYDPDTKPAWYSVYFFDPLKGKFGWGCRSEKEARILSKMQFDSLVGQLSQLEPGMSREEVAKTLAGFNSTHRPFLNAYPRDHDLYRLAISADDSSVNDHSYNLLISYDKQAGKQILVAAALVDLRDGQAIARDIKQDLARFAFHLDCPYRGPANERPNYKSLTLQTSPLEPGQPRPPWWTTAQISDQEANALVDHLANAGLLRRVRAIGKADVEPHYRLKLTRGGGDAYVQNLAWGSVLKTRLAEIQKILASEAGKALGQLLQALPKADKAEPPVLPELDGIRWHNPGIRHEFWLQLNPTGRYLQHGIHRKANDKIDRLAGQIFGGDGVVVPVEQYTETTEGKPVTGRWQWLSTAHGIVLLDKERGARLRRVGPEGTQYEFDFVRLSQTADLGAAIKDNWTPLDDTWSVETTDLAAWPGEQSLATWAKPARGYVVAKSTIPAATEKLIRTGLPESYSVTTFGNALLVARNGKGATEAHFPSAGNFGSTADAWNRQNEERFVVELKFGRRIAPADWQQQADQLDASLSVQREKMKAFADPPRSKPSGSGFHPRNAAETKLLDQYRALLRQRAALPEFYDETRSLHLHHSFGTYISDAKMSADKQRRQVEATIRQCFSRYELYAESQRLLESFRKQSDRLQIGMRQPTGETAITLAGPKASPAKTNETIVRITSGQAVAILDLLAARGYFEIKQDAGPIEDPVGSAESQFAYFQKARANSRLTLTATNDEDTSDWLAIGVGATTYQHWFRAIQDILTGDAAKAVGSLLAAGGDDASANHQSKDSIPAGDPTDVAYLRLLAEQHWASDRAEEILKRTAKPPFIGRGLVTLGGHANEQLGVLHGNRIYHRAMVGAETKDDRHQFARKVLEANAGDKSFNRWARQRLVETALTDGGVEAVDLAIQYPLWMSQKYVNEHANSVEKQLRTLGLPRT